MSHKILHFASNVVNLVISAKVLFQLIVRNTLPALLTIAMSNKLSTKTNNSMSSQTTCWIYIGYLKGILIIQGNITQCTQKGVILLANNEHQMRHTNWIL